MPSPVLVPPLVLPGDTQDAHLDQSLGLQGGHCLLTGGIPVDPHDPVPVRLLTRVFFVSEDCYQGWREYPPTASTAAIYADLLQGWPTRPRCYQIANMVPSVVGRLRDEISASICICLLSSRDLRSDRLLCLLDETCFRFAHHCRWAQRTLASLRAIWVYPPHISHSVLREITGPPLFVRGAFAHAWVDASFLPVDGQVPIFAGSVIRFSLLDDRGLCLRGGCSSNLDVGPSSSLDLCPIPFACPIVAWWSLSTLGPGTLTGGRPYTANEEMRRPRRTLNEQGFIGSPDYGVYCTVRAERLDYVGDGPSRLLFILRPIWTLLGLRAAFMALT